MNNKVLMVILIIIVLILSVIGYFYMKNILFSPVPVDGSSEEFGDLIGQKTFDCTESLSNCLSLSGDCWDILAECAGLSDECESLVGQCAEAQNSCESSYDDSGDYQAYLACMQGTAGVCGDASTICTSADVICDAATSPGGVCDQAALACDTFRALCLGKVSGLRA